MGNEVSVNSGNNDATAALLAALLQGATVPASSSADSRPLLWDPNDCSDNLDVSDNGTRVRRKDAPNRTDMVRATVGFGSGVHVWEITWPRASRGTHAVIGVATTRALLVCSGYKSLLGSDDQSLGWDIINNKSLFNGCAINAYPANKPPGYQVGDRIVVILNLNEGSISFCDGDEKLGQCLTGLGLFARNSQVLCPAVSITKPGAIVEMRDLTRRAGAPSPSAGPAPARPAVATASSTALHFIIPSTEKGLKLTNNNMSAYVYDANVNNKIVLSHRSLEDDELFQIKIDKLEGDVATTDLLNVGVVEIKAGDNTQHWTLISSHILHKGEKLQQFNQLDLEELKQGQRIGLMRRSNGCLDVYIDGSLKAKCNINIPRGVRAYVGLDGRAKQVTIVPERDDNATMDRLKARAKEIEKGINQTLALMNEKKPGKVKDVAVAVNENIVKARGELTSDEYRVVLADKIAELGGGHTIMEYLHFLRDQGLEVDNNFQCYCVILNALWKETGDCMKLLMALAENGLFELLHTQLISLKNKLAANKQKFGPLFGTCVGIVCNCAKRPENHNHLHKLKLDEVLLHFMNTSNNDENTILFCYVSVMFILPSTSVEQLTISLPALQKLVGFVKVAAADSAGGFRCTHNFGPLGAARMHGYELVMAVSALAQNKVARKDMADNRVFEHLVKYGAANTDTYHQELTLTAIHTLLGHDTVPIALRVSGLLPLVDRLMTSTNEGVRQEATRVNEKIKALKAPTKSTTTGMGKVMPTDKTKMCDFASLCQKFFTDLKLAGAYFDAKHNKCYCAKCYEAASGDQLPYFSRGQPAKDCGIPIGWYRFGLKAPPRAEAENAFNVYHRAYHGTNVEAVPKILREGQLLIPGDETMDGARLREKDRDIFETNNPVGLDTKQVFVSPSIRYVAYPTYAKPSKVTIDGKEYNAQVVMQVLIKPDAYSVGRETVVDVKSQIDPRFSNDEMEWSTKRRGAVILYGLIVRVIEE